MMHCPVAHPEPFNDCFVTAQRRPAALQTDRRPRVLGDKRETNERIRDRDSIVETYSVRSQNFL